MNEEELKQQLEQQKKQLEEMEKSKKIVEEERNELQKIIAKTKEDKKKEKPKDFLEGVEYDY